MNRFDAIVVAVGLILAGALGCTEVAMAFPENVRLGYRSCGGSCHISPSGGGALTGYGRSANEELASWSYEGQGQVLGVTELPEWAALGGDVRYINANVPSYDYHHKFLMQQDIELAVAPAPYLWLVASAGTYGERQVREYRRHYLMWKPSERGSVRIGRFRQAFGLGLQDHTAATRGPLGLGQNSEAYGTEVHVQLGWAEVFLAGTVGAEATQRLSRTDGYKVQARDVGTMSKVNVFLSDTAQAGVSYWWGSNPEEEWMVVGPHFTWGVTRDVYLMGEGYGKWASSSDGPSYFTFSQAGWEAVRGLHLQATHEYAGETHSYGAALTWYPLPHWEAKVQAKTDGEVPSYTALFHWWP